MTFFVTQQDWLGKNTLGLKEFKTEPRQDRTSRSKVMHDFLEKFSAKRAYKRAENLILISKFSLIHD